MSLAIKNAGLFEGSISAGLRLAELPEAQGGWKEYLSESEDGDLRIHDDILRSQTALVLENAKRQIARKAGGRRGGQTNEGLVVLDEATRSALVGGFSDYLFPVLRASFPTNAVNDLVSVQVTTRRTATIVFWNWVVGGTRAKGSAVPGQRLFDVQRGKQDAGRYFTSEYIDSEVVGTGNAGATPTLTALVYHDGGGVRPGTVRVNAIIAAAPVTVYDNGNGGWLNGIVGSIDYKTGAIVINWGANTDAGQPIIARYRWDSEGSALLPEVDVQITTSTVETERRAVKVNYSTEAMDDVLTEFGLSLEPSLISGASEQLNFEIARQLIAEMWDVAPVVASFNKTPPSSNYNQTQHYQDFAIPLNKASNYIWTRTQKAYGNWCVVDNEAATLIESLPGDSFEAAPRPANVQGLHFIGTLFKKFRVYKDIFLGQEPGASAHGNILMGYKGNDFYQAGLVYSPYRMLYSTATLETADFMNQKGMASRYATKMVNPDMYVRINLGA